MRTLLDFYLRYLDFIYRNPTRRTTNATTSGSAHINASLTVNSLFMLRQPSRAHLIIIPVPISGQYLDGYGEKNVVLPAELVVRVHDNARSIEEPFSDSSAAQSCKPLKALEDANALKYSGPPT